MWGFRGWSRWYTQVLLWFLVLMKYIPWGNWSLRSYLTRNRGLVSSQLWYLFYRTLSFYSGNGYITTKTLREILQALDDKLGPEDLDGIIAEIDTDGSGTVDFDGEFSLPKHPQHMFSLGMEQKQSICNTRGSYRGANSLCSLGCHIMHNMVLKFQPWTWSQYVLPNRWNATNRPQHDVLTQNARIWNTSYIYET